MTFLADKKKYLDKLYQPDNSKKGDVDEAMMPLLEAINNHPDYYTTSSCAGRIALYVEPDSGKKCDSDWHFVTHEKCSFDELAPQLKNLPNETVWFQMEAAILHVVARDEESANKLLHTAREAGFKHSGLMATTKRYVLELIDTERIDVPIAVDGALIVQEKFIKFLIKKANAKLISTRKSIEKLKNKI